MSYVLINGDPTETKYNDVITPFTTQHGYDAIRFVGDDIPESDKGFKMFDDNDKLISDLSDFKFLYRPNEYSLKKDIIEMPKGSDDPLPPSPYDKLNSRISRVSSQVTEITPYIESKTAYIDDTDVFFNIPKEGNISIFMTDGEGQNVPFIFEKVNGQVKVSFEKRDSLATVTMQIQ